jgi:hypothetical protein
MNMLPRAFGCLLLLTSVPFQDPAPAPTDETAVRRAALDYVEGLYLAKPDYIERSVHPELVKFGFWRKDASSPYEGSSMSKAQLVALAGKWNATGKNANEQSVKEVEVLDVLDQTAAVKVTAVWGIDYMHLAKSDGKWLIRHVLWQSHPLKSR